MLGVDTTKRVGDAIIRFMQEYDATHNKQDFKKQRLHYTRVFAYLLEKIGDIHLIKVQQKVLIEHAQAMRADGKSAATVNNYFSVINSLFRKCREEYEWMPNLVKVPLFTNKNAVIRWITRTDADKLISHLSPALGKLTEFTLQTGLRWANASGLLWEQVHLDRKCVIIEGKFMKNGKPLFIPLTPTAIKILKAQLGQHPVYVFITAYGKPFSKNPPKNLWETALNKAGITNFRWHDLRHTWASWHVQRGIALNTLMELGGWSSYEMVLRYAHLSKEHLREAVK